MAEPIHILHVVGNMGMGGYETLIMNIYRNIDRGKVQFDFMIHTADEGEYAEEIKALGGRIFHMPVLLQKPKVYYWRYFAYIRAIDNLFKTHPEFSIVHAHMTNTASIYMPIAKRYNNIKACIAHSHQSEATPGLQGRVTNFLQRNLSKVATDCFACSKKAAEWIYPEEMIRDNRVTVIYNGVDTSKFHYIPALREEVRKRLGIEGKFVVGNVARFKKQKNHTFLIDIFSEIHALRPDSVLILVGIGETQQEIREKVRAYGLEDAVMFLNGRNDVPALMNAFDLFLLPSLNEGLPLVAIEAQCAGLPIVTAATVSKETDLTGNVRFYDLSMPPIDWAKQIVAFYNGYHRMDCAEMVKNKGYDIRETARWLQDFYIRKCNGLN